jgi:hypothetical protein
VKLLLSLFFLCHSPAARAVVDLTHDLHVSVCELRWNEEVSTFEVSIKIFIDDLENALRLDGAPDLRIGTASENSEADKYLVAYLKKHFKISLDGHLLQPDLVGKEVTDDFQAVWCYVEFLSEIKIPKKCSLSNSILLDQFDDQSNIMDIRMNKSHKAYTIFQRGRSTWNYTF